MNPFKDKVAIVTGGASGIGRALCEELSRRNAIVLVADINLPKAQAVAAAITATNYRAHAIAIDVTHTESIQHVIETTITTYGRLDYMFNNAGIGLVAEVRDMEEEHWRRICDVNLWGVIHGTRLAYTAMIKQRHGHIVNTASGAGLFPLPLGAAYTTTKYAIVGLSTALRPEAAGLGINVSVVCPGAIRTNIFATTTFLKLKPERVQQQITTMPMMHPTTCALTILRGVAQNRAIITVTTLTRLTWWMYRYAPGLYDRLSRTIANRLRAALRQT